MNEVESNQLYILLKEAVETLKQEIDSGASFSGELASNNAFK